MISGPFFIGSLVAVSCRKDGHGTAFWHTCGHTGIDADVCLGAQVQRASCRPTAGTLLAAVRRTTIAMHALEDPSWTIRSRFVCPHRWVARCGGHPAASDDGLRTSS